MKISRKEHEKRLKELEFYFAFNVNECDDPQGTQYNPTKVAQKFGIGISTLYKYLDELKNNGKIMVTGPYSVKRFSRRVKNLKFNYNDSAYNKFCRSFGFDDKVSKFNFRDNKQREYYTSYMERINEPQYFEEHKTVEDRYIDFIDAALYEIVEYININSHPSLHLRYNLRFEDYEKIKRGKPVRIQQFSGRVFNNACLTKSGKKKYKEDDKKPFRVEFLKELGMDDYKGVYDIPSQIPRLTGFLNDLMTWDSGDVYDRFKTKAQLKISREDVKFLFMPLYFGKVSIGRIYAGDKRKKDWVDKSKILSLEEYKRLKDAIDGIIGKNFGNYIFLVTSITETLTLYRLKKAGHMVFNVYDCFYSNEEIRDLIKDTIRQVTEEFKQSLLNFDNFKDSILGERKGINEVDNH